MSFATDILHLMTNDTSLNTYCDGGIKYEYLPENFDLDLDWIVYSFNKTSAISCMDGDIAFTNYAFSVKIISTSTEDLETISDRLVDYLHGNEYGGIIDIIFSGDSHTLDLEKRIYMNTLNFDCIYST